MASTQEVLDHHLGAFGDGNLDGILEDYSEDAVVMTPEGTYTTPAEIAGFFKATLEEFAKPGMSFSLNHVGVNGETAFVVWDGETADYSYNLGSDTFTVRDGKILSQTYVYHRIAK